MDDKFEKWLRAELGEPKPEPKSREMETVDDQLQQLIDMMIDVATETINGYQGMVDGGVPVHLAKDLTLMAITTIIKDTLKER